jgi:hypothetical protein
MEKNPISHIKSKYNQIIFYVPVALPSSNVAAGTSPRNGGLNGKIN